jgi:homoserine dehydrogenase
MFEAAVGGGIPIISPLKHCLVSNEILSVTGIVNGTTNYILTQMSERGWGFDEALAEAQQLGYAEADPTADVEGYDAAAKAAILAGLAFHTRVRLEDVHREGITNVSAQDVAAARDMGFVIKLLAVAELSDDEKGLVVRVHPAMVPRTHPLAGVRGAFNAVFVEAESAGQVMFYGRGAGGAPTASAVLGDIVAVGQHRLAGTRGPGESTYAPLEVRPVGDAVTRYYVNLEVADRPGVLAAVAQAFADHDVSIQNVRQDGHGDDAGLVVRTHTARDSDLAATIERLRSSDSVRRVVGVMRVEGEGGR